MQERIVTKERSYLHKSECLSTIIDNNNIVIANYCLEISSYHRKYIFVVQAARERVELNTSESAEAYGANHLGD